MNIIKLKKRYEDVEPTSLFGCEFTCEITEKLDKLAGITKKLDIYSSFYRHYVLADKISLSEKSLVIRIPGGSLGYIKYDNKNIITDIFVDTNYVVSTYPKDVNEIISKLYIGSQLNLSNTIEELVRNDKTY
jgi:hypothetical protein